MKKKLLALAAVLLLIGSGCTDADVVSQNISTAADQFEVNRRVIFYNGITGDYMLEIDGLCSLGNYDPAGMLTVTCKTGPDSYKKHFLGLSDNVTYFVEQVDQKKASDHFYRVIFKPSVIIPDSDLECYGPPHRPPLLRRQARRLFRSRPLWHGPVLSRVSKQA